MPTVVVLTPGTTSWQVPTDWIDTGSQIICIGPGGGGVSGGAAAGAAGGGGGECRVMTNVDLTPGNTETVNIPAGPSAGATAASDTWFRATTFLRAVKGSAGSGLTGGAGGTGGVGGTGTNGGTGGAGVTGSVLTGGGGGGAGGPGGAGGTGGSGDATTTGDDGGGGGGSGGTLTAAGTIGTQGSTSGGAGGASAGQTAGTGGNGAAGGPGSNGGGGGGGDNGQSGGAGGAGSLYTASAGGTYGPGGGGGGGGNASVAGTQTGGAGGAYGGGGGGAETGGAGGGGLIVIIYPNVSATVNFTAASAASLTAAKAFSDPVAFTADSLASMARTAGLLASVSLDAVAAAAQDSVLSGGGGGWTTALDMLADETDGLAILARANSAAVKDSVGSLDYSGTINDLLSNVGTSPKTVVLEDGTLGWSAHNLVLYSQTWGSWTANGTPVISGQTITDDTTGNQEHVEQTVAAVQGERYCFTVWIAKDNDETRFPLVAIYSNGFTIGVELAINTKTGASSQNLVGSSGTASVTDDGTNWRLEVSIVQDSTTTRLYIIPARASTLTTTQNNAAMGSATVQKAQLCRGSTSVEYLETTSASRIGVALDYTNVEYQMLFEEARTNLAIYSQEIDNAAWTKTNVTVTANTGNAPDGTTTMDTLDEGTANDRHIIERLINGGANYFTASCYLQDIDRRYVHFQVCDDVGNGRLIIYVDLQTGTITDTETINPVTGTDFVASGVQALGNGIYRIWIIGKCSNDRTSQYFVLSLSDRSTHTGTFSFTNPSYTGTNKKIRVWGMQFEVARFASSYIPTQGTSVTRAADYVTISASLFPAGSEWSHYIKMSLKLGSTEARLLSYTEADGSAFIYGYPTTASSYEVGTWVTAPGLVWTATETGVAPDTSFEARVRYKTNDFAAYLVDGPLATDTTGGLPTPAVLEISSSNTATVGLQRIERIASVPRGVVDGDLPTWMAEPGGAVEESASFSANAALTHGAAFNFVRSASYDAAGALAVAPALAASASAAFSANAAASFARILSIPAAAAFSVNTTMTPAAQAALVASASYSAATALTAARQAALVAAASFASNFALTVASTASLLSSASYSASAALTAARTGVLVASAAFSADTSLTATKTSSIATLATFSAAVAASFVPALALSRSVAFSAAVTAPVTAQLSISTAAAFNAVATLGVFLGGVFEHSVEFAASTGVSLAAVTNFATAVSIGAVAGVALQTQVSAVQALTMAAAAGLSVTAAAAIQAASAFTANATLGVVRDAGGATYNESAQFTASVLMAMVPSLSVSQALAFTSSITATLERAVAFARSVSFSANVTTAATGERTIYGSVNFAASTNMAVASRLDAVAGANFTAILDAAAASSLSAQEAIQIAANVVIQAAFGAAEPVTTLHDATGTFEKTVSLEGIHEGSRTLSGTMAMSVTFRGRARN